MNPLLPIHCGEEENNISVACTLCVNLPKWWAGAGIAVHLVDTLATVETFGPWQKALVVLVLAMDSVEIGTAVAGSLAVVVIQPTDALVAAMLIVASLQCRLAITAAKTFVFVSFCFVLIDPLMHCQKNGHKLLVIEIF